MEALNITHGMIALFITRVFNVISWTWAHQCRIPLFFAIYLYTQHLLCLALPNNLGSLWFMINTWSSNICYLRILSACCILFTYLLSESRTKASSLFINKIFCRCNYAELSYLCHFSIKYIFLYIYWHCLYST